jgi:hydroxymethylbilane synthase
VAIEIRASDRATAAVLAQVSDQDAMSALEAERSLVKALEGDCQVPIGALATLDAGTLKLDAVVASLDGKRVLRRCSHGPVDAAGALGEDLARQLLDDGADAILAQHR